MNEKISKLPPPRPPNLVTWRIELSIFNLIMIAFGALLYSKPLLLFGGIGLMILSLSSMLNIWTKGILDRTLETYAFSFMVIGAYVLTRYKAKRLMVNSFVDFVHFCRKVKTIICFQFAPSLLYSILPLL